MSIINLQNELIEYVFIKIALPIFYRCTPCNTFEVPEKVRSIIKSAFKANRLGRWQTILYKKTLGVADTDFYQEIPKCLFRHHLKISTERSDT